MLLTLTLSFVSLISINMYKECIFKYLFRYQTPYVNDFERDYRPTRLPNGEQANLYVPHQQEHLPSAYRGTGDRSQNFRLAKLRREEESTNKNFWLHVAEFLVAVTLSVAIHTMSFENGGRKLRE